MPPSATSRPAAAAGVADSNPQQTAAANANAQGKDRLRRAKLPEGETYWVTREKQRDHKHFEKGF